MLANVKVAVGDTLLFPYSNEVAAGEPTAHKAFHAKYQNQECVVKKIRKSTEPRWLSPRTHILFTVRFADGAVNELLSGAFVYVGKKKKAKKKK
jgi:hypothetical protein